MKNLVSLLIAALALLGLMSGNVIAAGVTAAADTDIATLLTGIDFDLLGKAVMGMIAAGVLYFMAKGGGVQVMHFVKRILGA